MNTVSKNCVHCKKEFLITEDDFVFYEKMQVLPPTHCPLCRQIRRISFRNFRTLYNRVSDKSGVPIISMYHDKQPFPVWNTEEWYKDDWDATSFGKEFDFTRPFFEQFKELQNTVPHFSLMVNNSVNCGYSNMCNRSSNCYFVFGCVDNEYCEYSHSVWNCKESLDSLYLFKSENCYECTDVLESNKLFYSQECEGCSDSIGLFDCRGCIDCIGCVGLRNKSYYIFNKQVTKEEYKEFLTTHPISDPNTITLILNKVKELRKTIPTPALFGSHNVDVSGNHIYHAKNVHYAFDVKGGEDSKFGFTIRKMVDSYDCCFSLDVEHLYESMFSQGYGLRFCHICIDCSETAYSQFCFNVNNCFGCVGLRKKEYCILNKQYTKEEYEKLLPKIITHMKKTGEWSEFFPVNISPYTYNESTANEYYPLTEAEAQMQGFFWKQDIPYTTGKENSTIELYKGEDLYNRDLLKDKVFACTSCTRNYRFTDHELSFYEKFKLALPKECFFCRHDRRMNSRSRRELSQSTCDNCGTSIQTAENKKDGKKVFCEDCYRKEIV